MKTATELLHAYLDNVQDADTTTALFAPDGAIELPYLESLGIPGTYKGHEAIHGFLTFVVNTYPDFGFINKKVFIETPDHVAAEYEVHAHAAATNRYYRQLFFGRLQARDGKIVLLREALNLVTVGQAILPNGLADIVQQKAPAA